MEGGKLQGREPACHHRLTEIVREGVGPVNSDTVRVPYGVGTGVPWDCYVDGICQDSACHGLFVW